MSAPLLRIQNLNLAADERVLLRDFSLAMDPGEFVAVVGESGSGKTLATRAIVDLLPPGVERIAGTVSFDGRELTKLSGAPLRRLRGREIGMVFQEPMTSLNPSMRIGRQIEEGLKLHRQMSAVERREAALAMLSRVRIADPEACLASYPHEFSGGMRQRILLAAVMLLKPRLLIADEPTTALDSLSQREVMDIIAELAREVGTAVILITHDLGLVAQYAERAVVLEQGRTAEQGASAQILREPRDPYTKRLVAALPKPGENRLPREGTLLEIDRLSVVYPRRGAREPIRAVDDVSLSIAPGEVVAVVGGSGSGKTTLGRAVLGLVEAESGSIRFAGLDPNGSDGADRRAFRRATQLVFQDPYSSLDPRMRLHEIVAEPLRHHPEWSSAERRRRVDDLLAEVGLAELAGRFPHQLSGGQRQRASIARAVITNPRFIVADEPVSALDLTIQAQVLRLFARLQAEYGFACLFVSHDLGVVEQIADRVLVMLDGKIVEQGTRNAVFDAPSHWFTRQLLSASPRLLSGPRLASAASGKGDSPPQD